MVMAPPEVVQRTKVYDRAMKDPREFARLFARTLKSGEDTAVEAALFPVDDHEYFDEAFSLYMSRDNVICEKTKQVAMSWFGGVTRCWSVITPYRAYWRSVMMSRSQTLVDDGGINSTPDSLLGKVKFVYDHLPLDLQFPVDFAFNRIKNPATRSVIRGVSTTSQAGRGGNYEDGWWDEASFFLKSESVFSACSDGVPLGLWLVSTPSPWGKSTAMYRLRQHPGTGRRAYRLFRVGWWQHPGRRCECTGHVSLDPNDHSGCWFASYAETHTEQQINQEQGISWEFSQSGRVFNRFDASVHIAEHVPILEGLPIHRAWDFGVGDQTAVTIYQVQWIHTVNQNLVPQIRIIEEVVDKGKAHTFYREKLQNLFKHHGWNTYAVDDIGDPYSLNARDSALNSWRINLCNGEHPYKIYVEPTGCVGQPYDTVLDNARKFMNLVDVTNEHGRLVKVPRMVVSRKRCPIHIAMFESASYKTDDQGEIISQKPIHDKHSHPLDSFKYGCWKEDPPAGHTVSPAEVGNMKDHTDGEGEFFEMPAEVFEGGWIE